MRKIVLRMKTILLLCAMIFNSGSCSKTEEVVSPPNNSSSQKMYFNAKIFTLNNANPWAEAIVIDGNRIVFVGSNTDATAFADSGAEKIDVQGKLVLPGFHDVHMHPMEVGDTSVSFELSDTETNAENYRATIRSASLNDPGNHWLIGFGHSFNTLIDANRNPLDIIDQAVPDRPVIIMEQTSHSMWLNSKALEKAGITATSPNPQGGIIMKEGGVLSGILIDNAGDIVYQQAISELNADGEYNGMVTTVLPELAKHGITSVSDARTYWRRDQHVVWKRLADDGKLTARFNLGLWAYPSENDASQIASLKALYSNDENSLLKINQIKLYSDGITHNTTAALDRDYQIDYFNLSTNNGLNYFTESRIRDYIQQLESTGFDFHIHAIGNRGVTEALNAIQQGASTNGRHRLTHVEMVNTSDLTRFSQLNVTADAQVAGEFTQPHHWNENAYLVGNALANNLIPIKSLVDAGARITLSSDWNVSTLNPFVGIQNAVTRSPQNISLEMAIKAYTINGAYVMRQEDKVGSLETGKLADFIIVDRDIFTISTTQINQAKIERTVFNGVEIFRR